MDRWVVKLRKKKEDLKLQGYRNGVRSGGV